MLLQKVAAINPNPNQKRNFLISLVAKTKQKGCGEQKNWTGNEIIMWCDGLDRDVVVVFLAPQPSFSLSIHTRALARLYSGTISLVSVRVHSLKHHHTPTTVDEMRV